MKCFPRIFSCSLNQQTRLQDFFRTRKNKKTNEEKCVAMFSAGLEKWRKATMVFIERNYIIGKVTESKNYGILGQFIIEKIIYRKNINWIPFSLRDFSYLYTLLTSVMTGLYNELECSLLFFCVTLQIASKSLRTYITLSILYIFFSPMDLESNSFDLIWYMNYFINKGRT